MVVDGVNGIRLFSAISAFEVVIAEAAIDESFSQTDRFLYETVREIYDRQRRT